MQSTMKSCHQIERLGLKFSKNKKSPEKRHTLFNMEKLPAKCQVNFNLKLDVCASLQKYRSLFSSAVSEACVFGGEGVDELLVPLLPGDVLIVGQDRRLLGVAPCRADFGQSAFVSGQVLSEIIPK